MKNLSIEEKSKRYDEALDEAKTIHKAIKQELKPVIEQIFPEVKESEDERMWKLIKKYAHYNISELALEADHITREHLESWLEKQAGQDAITFNNAHIINHALNEYCCKQYDALYKENGGVLSFARLQHLAMDIYGWCKKQGEQNHVDKVEPKFKVDDFIVYKDNIWKVCNIALQSYYELLKINNEVSTISIEDVDENAHLWTIKDAKEGDVLSYVTDEGDLWIMIYWSLYEPYEGHVHYHALLVNDDVTDKGTCCICIDDLKPASKEQRDLLFQKMKESGYRWDADKKKTIKL